MRFPAAFCAVFFSTAVLSCVSGCASTPRFETRRGNAPGHVFLLPGTVGYWPGVQSYTASLKEQGISSTVVYGHRSLGDSVANVIESALCTECVSQPIVLVGYSEGAEHCIDIARTCDRRGIPISGIFAIEAGKQFRVPGNVGFCFNLYRSDPATDWIPILRGLPLTAESQCTQLINWDARHRQCCWGQLLGQLGHLEMGKSSYVCAFIMGQLRLMMGACESCTEVVGESGL